MVDREPQPSPERLLHRKIYHNALRAIELLAEQGICPVNFPRGMLAEYGFGPTAAGILKPRLMLQHAATDENQESFAYTVYPEIIIRQAQEPLTAEGIADDDTLFRHLQEALYSSSSSVIQRISINSPRSVGEGLRDIVVLSKDVSIQPRTLEEVVEHTERYIGSIDVQAQLGHIDMPLADRERLDRLLAHFLEILDSTYNWRQQEVHYGPRADQQDLFDLRVGALTFLDPRTSLYLPPGMRQAVLDEDEPEGATMLQATLGEDGYVGGAPQRSFTLDCDGLRLEAPAAVDDLGVCGPVTITRESVYVVYGAGGGAIHDPRLIINYPVGNKLRPVQRTIMVAERLENSSLLLGRVDGEVSSLAHVAVLGGRHITRDECRALVQLVEAGSRLYIAPT